jgi:hypothetical protein
MRNAMGIEWGLEHQKLSYIMSTLWLNGQWDGPGEATSAVRRGNYLVSTFMRCCG